MLNKMFKSFHRNNKGFTLVELMVVVVIIGVLTAIAIPVYNNSTEKAALGACQANQRMIEGAVQQYKANSENGTTIPTMAQLMEDGYFVSEPRCPSNKAGSYTIDATTGKVTCPAATPHADY